MRGVRGIVRVGKNQRLTPHPASEYARPPSPSRGRGTTRFFLIRPVSRALHGLGDLGSAVALLDAGEFAIVLLADRAQRFDVMADEACQLNDHVQAFALDPVFDALQYL